MSEAKKTRQCDNLGKRQLSQANTKDHQKSTTFCGERAFSHAGPAAWNAPPEDMRAVSDSMLFRKRLKTHLFSVAFTFVDYCLLLMTLVMHLCSPCNWPL